MTNGMNNWNRLNTPVTFLPNQSTNNRVNAGVQRFNYLGLINSVPLGVPFIPDRFTISLNSCAIIDYAARHDANLLYTVVASIMAHELGHAVGLQDNPIALNNGSLMNHRRNRTLVQEPTQFDIESVRMIYDD